MLLLLTSTCLVLERAEELAMVVASAGVLVEGMGLVEVEVKRSFWGLLRQDLKTFDHEA